MPPAGGVNHVPDAMRTRRPFRAARIAGLAALALAACQDPDVGQPCALDLFADGGAIDTDVQRDKGLYSSCERADYFRSGAVECESLICVRSATGSATGTCPPPLSPVAIRKYCSKACVSDTDCFNKDTGLVCRQIVLDPVFLANLDPQVRDRYLGQIQSSNYCAAPVPP
jgi:hypothetical protein